MSTRERAQLIFDSLTEEQLEKLMEYMEDNFLPEPPNTAHSLAELEEMLEDGMEDIRNGKTVSLEEAGAETMGMIDKWRS